MSSPMTAALQQVYAIFKNEQARQEQVLRNALDSISIVSSPSTTDEALERLRLGLDMLNNRPVAAALSQTDEERLNILGDHLAAAKNGMLQ